MSGELSPKGDCGQAWGGNEGTCSEPVDRLQTVSVMSVIAKEFALSRPVGELAVTDQNAAMIDELCRRGVERIYPPNSIAQHEATPSIR